MCVLPAPSMGPGKASDVCWAKLPEGLAQSFGIKEAGPGKSPRYLTPPGTLRHALWLSPVPHRPGVQHPCCEGSLGQISLFSELSFWRRHSGSQDVSLTPQEVLPVASRGSSQVDCPLGLEERVFSCMKWQEAGYLLSRPPRRKGLCDLLTTPHLLLPMFLLCCQQNPTLEERDTDTMVPHLGIRVITHFYP